MSIDHHLGSGIKELERNEKEITAKFGGELRGRSWTCVIARRIAAIAKLPELLRKD